MQIPAREVMKYQQTAHYGSSQWLLSFNRRTYVEGLFDNLKNMDTRSI